MLNKNHLFCFFVCLIFTFTPVSAIELPVVPEAERDEYWLETAPFNFKWTLIGGPRYRQYDGARTGYCFNVSFVINEAGEVQSVKTLKLYPQSFEPMAELLKRPQIWSRYKFKPAPENTTKSPILTHLVFFKQGPNPNHADYLSDVETACHVDLEQAVRTNTVSNVVDDSEIDARGAEELEKVFSEKSCELGGLDCTCAREKFKAKWTQLGLSASLRNVGVNEIREACRISPSEDEIIAEIRANAAKMRKNVCEKSPAMQGYDCACFEKLEVEKGIASSKIIPYGPAQTRMSLEKRKALRELNKTYSQRLVQECTKPAEPITETELAEERQDVLRKCNSSAEMNQNVRCDCLADKFAEKRRQEGRELGQSHIITTVSNLCINIDKKVDNAYQTCLKGKIFFDLKGTPLPDYCSCVSENYGASMTANANSLTSRSIARLLGDAKDKCRLALPL